MLSWFSVLSIRQVVFQHSPLPLRWHRVCRGPASSLGALGAPRDKFLADAGGLRWGHRACLPSHGILPRGALASRPVRCQPPFLPRQGLGSPGTSHHSGRPWGSDTLWPCRSSGSFCLFIQSCICMDFAHPEVKSKASPGGESTWSLNPEVGNEAGTQCPPHCLPCRPRLSLCSLPGTSNCLLCPSLLAAGGRYVPSGHLALITYVHCQQGPWSSGGGRGPQAAPDGDVGRTFLGAGALARQGQARCAVLSASPPWPWTATPWPQCLAVPSEGCR